MDAPVVHTDLQNFWRGFVNSEIYFSTRTKKLVI